MCIRDRVVVFQVPLIKMVGSGPNLRLLARFNFMQVAVALGTGTINTAQAGAASEAMVEPELFKAPTIQAAAEAAGLAALAAGAAPAP